MIRDKPPLDPRAQDRRRSRRRCARPCRASVAECRYGGSKSPLAPDAGNGHTYLAEEAPNDQGRTRVRARVYLHQPGRTDIERQSVLEETQVSFADKTLTCRDCGQEFVWTAGEQEFYQSRGLQNPPSRCLRTDHGNEAVRRERHSEASRRPLRWPVSRRIRRDPREPHRGESPQ